MTALAPRQDENGMFREVHRLPGCVPGVLRHVDDRDRHAAGHPPWMAGRRPRSNRSWTAPGRPSSLRTASDGRLLDVAESTGTRGLTQKDYLRRAAILGPDPRGGAFAMLLATEIIGIGTDD